MSGLHPRHPLLRTLVELRGNPRACVYTEPMWGLSMNLCLPYASVFMLGLGLTDANVGMVASVYLFSQMVCSFLSGVLVDKLGRRWSTFLADVIGWCLPCLIWASSQGFWFFVVAAVLNGTKKVSEVSWDCLMVEDAPRDKITHIYSWVVLTGNLSALFAPIASVLVSQLTLVPAIRILYVNAFVIMTIKALLLLKFSHETEMGVVRRAQTKSKSWGELLGGYKQVARGMIHTRGIAFALVISVVVEVVMMLGMTFWQIIASRRIGVPDALLPIFPMIRSLLAILFFFTVIGRIRQTHLKFPLFGGFACCIVAYSILICLTTADGVGYALLIASLIFEALGIAVLNTLRESLVALHLRPEERSRMLSLLQMTVMLISVPFGYLGGILSGISRTLPFVLCLTFLVIGAAATALFYRHTGEANPAQP